MWVAEWDWVLEDEVEDRGRMLLPPIATFPPSNGCLGIPQLGVAWA